MYIMSSASSDRSGPTRADARDNRERLIQAARAVFEEQGAGASLNEVARRAVVGPGTLYRNFPNLQALLAILIRDDIDAVCSSGAALLSDPAPADALQRWLAKGLVATQLAAEFGTDSPTDLAECLERLQVTGIALIQRAQFEGGFSRSGDIRDLLRLAMGIAWITTQVPGDEGLLDRLVSLAVEPSQPRTVIFPAGPTTVLPPRPEAKGIFGKRWHGRNPDRDPSD
jgi:AcrR family transcriptional regulator